MLSLGTASHFVFKLYQMSRVVEITSFAGEKALKLSMEMTFKAKTTLKDIRVPF